MIFQRLWNTLAFPLILLLDRLLSRLHLRLPGLTYVFFAPSSAYPVHIRLGSSDRQVLTMIYTDGEYGALDSLGNVRLIVDCGANVGYSSAYFLNQFPQAHLIAVEPDDGNFAMLRRNLQPYADRITLYPAGLWSHPAGLVVCKGQYRDGREWATQVRESRDGETADIQAMDVETLLAASGMDAIDLLKIDIERSEAEVFSHNCAIWLPQVKNLVIELHDAECERIFFQALSSFSYDLSRSGELTICRNLRLVSTD